MKKVLIIILVIAFVLIFLAGGVVAKVNEDAFFDKLPIAYHNLTYDFMGEIEKLEGDDFGELLLDIPDFLVAPFVYFFDALRSTAFLLRAEPEQMVLQKYGGRVYVYSNSRAGIDKVRPTKVNSIEECTDWRKQYVLPDGYIYAARQVVSYVDDYTNIADVNGGEWLANKRLSTSSTSTLSGSYVTRYIPCKLGDIIRIKGLGAAASGQSYGRIHVYNSSKSLVVSDCNYLYQLANFGKLQKDGDTITFVAGYTVSHSATLSEWSDTAYIRVCGPLLSGYTLDDVVITVNEEIRQKEVATWKWYNTNQVYDDTEYADSNGGFYDGWLVADYEKTSYLSFTTPAKPGYVYKYDLNQERFTAVVLPSVSLD